MLIQWGQSVNKKFSSNKCSGRFTSLYIRCLTFWCTENLMKKTKSPASQVRNVITKHHPII